MNNEVVKAMNRKPSKESNFKKWWSKNGYKVWRIVLFPIWAYVWSKEKIEKRLNAQNAWSEERAKEILNYYIPRCAHWNNENKTFYYFNNGYGWEMHFAKRHLKRQDRRFWNLYAAWRIRPYLINTYQLEGFTKTIGNCYDGWTEITFRMKTED